MNHPPLIVELDGVFRRHRRVHVAFSGGKDSLVLADLCKPWREQVVLIWANTGIMWPHMCKFVRSYSGYFRLIEARPPMDIFDFWRVHGLPADVLPVDHVLDRPRALPKLQPYTSCCSAMRTNPIIAVGLADGMTALLHGQRRADDVFRNHQDFGGHPLHVETAGPLWDWTHDQIWEYLTYRDISLPEQYNDPAIQRQIFGSLECAACPAHNSAGNRSWAARTAPELAKMSQALGRHIRSHAIRTLSQIESEERLEASECVQPTRTESAGQ